MTFDPRLDTFAIQGTRPQTSEAVRGAVLGQVVFYPVRWLLGSFKGRMAQGGVRRGPSSPASPPGAR